MPVRHALVAATLLSLFSLSARAQTAAIASADPSRGAALLPGSSAWADDATALVFNPAGLGRQGSLTALYQHTRQNIAPLDGDGLWLGTAIADNLGLGLGLEWLTPKGELTRSRTTFGFSLGPEAFSLGLGFTWNGGGLANGLTTVDLGVQSRPFRGLSLGLVVRNANAPARADLALSREVVLAMGIRPLGERFTFGVDWLAQDKAPLSESRLQYTAQGRVIDGVRLLAGVSHGLSPSQPLMVQLGLGLDLEHLGYAQGVGSAGNAGDLQFVVRYSAETMPHLFPAKKLAVVSLGGIGETSQNTFGALLGTVPEDRFLKLLRSLDAAARDPELAGLVLKIETANIGLARADELRAAVLELRAAGKKVYAFILSANDAEYLVASACDAIYAAPESMFLVDGLRSTVTFFGGAAEKLGVGVDVARVGAYKSFPEQFTRSSMSAEQKEAISAYLDTSARVLEARVLSGRPAITSEAWRAAVDEGLKSTARAKALHQVDELLTPKGLDDLLRAELPGASVERRYSPLATHESKWGSSKQIAIIPVLGSIAGGRNQSSPLGNELIAGAESFIESITQAAEDDDVKAIVVRVDSGGGDGLASYLMEQAVLEAKKKKPVIASMGDVAASGGYYVATAADEVWASPATLTGSIGVFFAKPAVQGLAEKLGVTQESIARGKLAGITDLYTPWTDEQKKAAQAWVDTFYDTFITEVAATRGLSKEAVDAVARGRIWSGEDAKARGLVNRLGGLMDAVAAARTRAGLAKDDPDVELVVWHSTRSVTASLLGASVPEGVRETALPGQRLPKALEELTRRLGPDAWLFESPGPQARLEHGISVE